MFTFKPAPKNGSNGNGNGNGHTNGNGTGHSSASPASSSQPAEPVGNGNGKNGHGQSKLGGWFGLGARNGHAAARPAAVKNGNGNGHSRRVESVIGPGISLRGTLTGAGGVRIEGSFDGKIDIEGALVVADGAKVTADIRAGAVSVGGSVKGDIVAGKVEILATGRVWGDLVTTAFATEEGAFLRGQVRMEDQLPAAEAPEPERVNELAPI